VNESLKAGKAVYVEKPLAVTQSELDEIQENYYKFGGRLMVGFNRRFSESFTAIKSFFEQRKMPLNMIYRVNAGQIPKNHWVQQPEQGGRIIGEACHFVDTLTFICGALPTEIYAQSVSSVFAELANNDNVNLNLKFADGSIGTIIYTSGGDSSMPKEYFECFGEGKSAVMNNFKEVLLFRGGKSKSIKFDGEKGIRNEIRLTVEAVKKGLPMPISPEELFSATKATFLSIESIKSGNKYSL
jgi:predicted dehydrogenase